MLIRKQLTIEAGVIPPKSLWERLVELWNSLSLQQQIALVAGTGVVITGGLYISRKPAVVVLRE